MMRSEPYGASDVFAVNEPLVQPRLMDARTEALSNILTWDVFD